MSHVTIGRVDTDRKSDSSVCYSRLVFVSTLFFSANLSNFQLSREAAALLKTNKSTVHTTILINYFLILVCSSSMSRFSFTNFCRESRKHNNILLSSAKFTEDRI